MSEIGSRSERVPSDGFCEITSEFPDVRHVRVIDLGSTVRAGVGVPDVTLNYDLRDHRNTILEIAREVLVENFRTKAGRSIRKLGALVDIYVVAPEVEFGQHVRRKHVHVVNTDVVAVGHLIVQQTFKTTRSGNRLPEAGVAGPHAIMIAELVVYSSAALVLTRVGLGSIKSVVWVCGRGC